jgi:glycosyltransferase involved in cell wall biosynthesis
MTFKPEFENQLDSDICFSVVTVVKDDLIGLKKTRKSLENQSYKNWRHIIIDGDSGQETQKFLSSLSVQDTFYVSEPDSGVYEAMNKAWKLADPQSFVFYLNAADVFADTNSLLEANAAMKTNSYASWGCTTHEEIQEDGDGWVCKLVSPPSVANQLFAFGYRSHQAVIMKAEFIAELGGFDESYRIAADWDLIVRAMLVDKPIIWSHPLAVFQLGGLSQANMARAHQELRQLRRIHLGKSAKQNILDYLWQNVYLRYFGYSSIISPIFNILFPLDKNVNRKKFVPKLKSNLGLGIYSRLLGHSSKFTLVKLRNNVRFWIINRLNRELGIAEYSPPSDRHD